MRRACFCAEKRTEERRMPKVISLFSPVGGIGKSTFAYHLALSLSDKGKKVLLLDASSSPSLDFLADVGEEVVYTLSDVAKELCPLSRAALPLKADGTLSFVPSLLGEPLTGQMISSALRRDMDEGADIIILDADISQAEDARAFSSQTILLTDLRESSLRSAEAAASGGAFDAFLLTFASFSYEGVQREAPVIDVVDRVSLPLCGILPYAPVLRTVRAIPRRTPYAKALENVASRFAGEEVPLLKGVTLDGMTRRYYIERAAKNKNQI